MKNLPESIIISRTDNLGDVMLTLPMTGYLKSLAPAIKIYFLGKSYTRSIIEASRFVDQFIDRDEIIKDNTGLAKIKAQAIIFAGPDQEVAKVAKKAGIPLRIGTSHRWFHWLYCNQRVNFSRKKSDLHEAQLNFKLLAPFDILTEPTFEQIKNWYGLTLPFRTSDFSDSLHPDKFNLIIHPKSKGSAKEWGLKNYADLIAVLPETHFQVLITGVKKEGELIRAQEPRIFGYPHVKDITGCLSLNELIELIGAADGFLAGSTGPLHIASALGKYTLGIYPPIRPMHPGRWQPIGENAHYLALEKKCNDCRKSDQCACVKAIEIAQVKALLQEFVKKVS